MHDKINYFFIVIGIPISENHSHVTRMKSQNIILFVINYHDFKRLLLHSYKVTLYTFFFFFLEQTMSTLALVVSVLYLISDYLRVFLCPNGRMVKSIGCPVKQDFAYCVSISSKINSKSSKPK